MACPDLRGVAFLIKRWHINPDSDGEFHQRLLTIIRALVAECQERF